MTAGYNTRARAREASKIDVYIDKPRNIDS